MLANVINFAQLVVEESTFSKKIFIQRSKEKKKKWQVLIIFFFQEVYSLPVVESTTYWLVFNSVNFSECVNEKLLLRSCIVMKEEKRNH